MASPVLLKGVCPLPSSGAKGYCRYISTQMHMLRTENMFEAATLNGTFCVTALFPEEEGGCFLF